MTGRGKADRKGGKEADNERKRGSYKKVENEGKQEGSEGKGSSGEKTTVRKEGGMQEGRKEG